MRCSINIWFGPSTSSGFCVGFSELWSKSRWHSNKSVLSDASTHSFVTMTVLCDYGHDPGYKCSSPNPECDTQQQRTEPETHINSTQQSPTHTRLKMFGIRVRILMVVIVAFAAAILRTSGFTHSSQNETKNEKSDVNGEVENHLTHFLLLISGMVVLLLVVGLLWVNFIQDFRVDYFYKRFNCVSEKKGLPTFKSGGSAV